VSHDGRWTLTTDFRCPRPETRYAAAPEANDDVHIPEDSGIWRVDPDGKNLFIYPHMLEGSHFVWRDAEHVLLWARGPEQKECRFYLCRDRSEQAENRITSRSIWSTPSPNGAWNSGGSSRRPGSDLHTKAAADRSI
jgi:hypothetical protein